MEAKDLSEIRQRFNMLYEQYADKIFAYIWHIVKDKGRAMEIAHDVFIKGYTRLDRFKSESSIKTWLYAIARNASYDYLKHLKYEPRISMQDKTGQGEDAKEIAELVSVQLAQYQQI